MSRLLRLTLLPLLAASAAGCSNFVEGNGVYAERTLEAGAALPPFSVASIGFPDDVDVSGHPPSASVYADALVRRVVLSGDQNVIEHITVSVDQDGTLVTSIDVKGYTSVHPPQLHVDAPGLTGVASRGGADVAVHEAPASAFSVVASGGGHVVLDGTGGTTLQATLSGAAQLDAAAYQVVAADLALTGTSRATVWPQQAVTGSAADGSAVLVKGSAGCGVTLTGGATCGPLQ